MKIVLLDSHAADQDQPDAWSALAALGELVRHPRTTPDQRLDRCRDAEAVITNKVVLDGRLLDRLPALRYIGVSATGFNVVELATARRGGVAVTNVPGYAAEAVAQLVFAQVLQLLLDVAGHSAAVKAGRWAASPDFCFFLRPLPELAGKTLVTLGRGAIGTAVARIATAFGMNVIAAAVPGSRGAGARVPLVEALPLADVVTLHCPLTPATEKLVGQEFLRRLPPHAILVNTSRGGLVDEPALVAALDGGLLGAVAADVLSSEPPPADHPLLDPRAPWAHKVLVTPHIGWGTVEARARLRAQVAENLAAFVAGRRLNRVD